MKPVQMTIRILITVATSLVIGIPLYAGTPAEDLLKKPDSWYQSDDAKTTLNHILEWQTKYGDWPKNTDTTRENFPGNDNKSAGTFDNGATTGELRVLAKAARITRDSKYEKAFLLGFDHILTAQYPNGGWPQYYPLSKSYHRHITFNDGTMIRILEFLEDATQDDDFAFLDQGRRTAAEKAIERGIECILKCQIVVAGNPTVWCAQHHAETLAPVQARSYEHPSLSGAESAGILRFLMNIEKPSPKVIRSVEAGVAWFGQTRLDGYLYRKSNSEPALTKSPNASPLWARFYEIGSNRPIFSDRDGVVKYDLMEIGSERRGGYTWYGNWGAGILKTYKTWPHRTIADHGNQ